MGCAWDLPIKMAELAQSNLHSQRLSRIDFKFHSVDHFGTIGGVHNGGGSRERVLCFPIFVQRHTNFMLFGHENPFLIHTLRKTMTVAPP